MEKVNIENLLRDLEETVSGASRIPLTGKVLVDGDTVLEYVDKIYAVLPEELKQARQVLDQSDKLLESMEGQGKRILEDARREAAMLVEQSEIIKEARYQADEIIVRAEQAANELRNEAVSYADEVLRQLELNLDKATYSLKKSRDDLRGYHTPQTNNNNDNQ